MDQAFKGYYEISGDRYQTLWNEGLVVLDTSVLLNLYRYKEHTSTNVLAVLDKLGNQLWIPHHVMLEFQINRPKTIKGQLDLYADVKKSVARNLSKMREELSKYNLDKRHAFIDTTSFLSSIGETQREFESYLSDLKSNSVKSSTEDRIRDELDDLLVDKIGTPLGAQNVVDELIKEGETRYKYEIPPVFEDKDKVGHHRFEGVAYPRKYGDLIAWKQIIIHAKSENIKNLIFVTDDNKIDWWWKEDVKSAENIGARPELVEEISKEAGVENFQMYSTEGFLSRAAGRHNVYVSESELENVRAVASFPAYYQFANRYPTLFGRELITTKRIWEKADFSGTRWTCGDYVPTHANQQAQVTWVFNPDGTGEWHPRGRTIPPDINWSWSDKSLMISYSDGRSSEFLVTAHEGLVWDNGDEFYLIEHNGELSRSGFVHCFRDVA